MVANIVSIMLIINIKAINFIMIISDIIIVITISASKVAISLFHCTPPVKQILAQITMHFIVKPLDNNINIKICRYNARDINYEYCFIIFLIVHFVGLHCHFKILRSFHHFSMFHFQRMVQKSKNSRGQQCIILHPILV